MSQGFKDKLAAAKLPERTVEICLRGDLQADFEQADRELMAAAEAAPNDGRLVSAAGTKKLITRLEALREEMKGAIQVFRLRAMPRGRYSALMADHPAAADDERDLGYCPESFFPDALRRSIVEPPPEDLDDETWETLLGAITDQQYNELVAAMQMLNQRPVSIPFSRAALLLTRPTEPGSTPQGG